MWFRSELSDPGGFIQFHKMMQKYFDYQRHDSSFLICVILEAGIGKTIWLIAHIPSENVFIQISWNVFAVSS